MNKLQKLWHYIVRPRFSRFLLSLMHNGYLLEIGWYDTLFKKTPIDKEKKPIPWTTYSYIEFIKSYLKSNMTLFEYGSGNSTLFYADYVRQLISVEHDNKWYSKIKSLIPGHCNLIFSDVTSEEYICPDELKNNKFDVIIIDGRRRNECIVKSEPSLKDNGIMVLDDSERAHYAEGIDFLTDKGYKKIDFWGIAPMYFHNKCTTVFYKTL